MGGNSLLTGLGSTTSEVMGAPEGAMMPSEIATVMPPATPDLSLNPPRATVALGDQFSCALRRGKVFCWGANGSGELGVPGEEARSRPVEVPGLSGVVALTAARSHAGALHADGTVSCWGDGGFGRVSAVPTDVERQGPTRVVGVSDVVQLALAENHSCVLRRDGSVWCWGRNRLGELGDGNIVQGAYEASPAVRVPGIGSASSIAAFGSLTAAIVEGDVYYWGAGAYRVANRGGSGHIPIQPVTPEELGPRRIEGLSGIMRISLHRHHGYALTTDGRVLGFGAAQKIHQADRPEPRVQTVPGVWPIFEVEGLGAVAEVVAGAGHGCARLRDGTVRCWGADPSMPGAGIRGDGQHGYELPPSSLALRADEIAGGPGHVAARVGHRVLTWGTGWAGQLGTGDTESRNTPEAVQFP
ncbi:MAG: alpha-tubulin suppressor-like RCC1 family protein [Myxococcota bacterium]|jgi:alpha-tubulin suppressor-like RCC1 family protein